MTCQSTAAKRQPPAARSGRFGLRATGEVRVGCVIPPLAPRGSKQEGRGGGAGCASWPTAAAPGALDQFLAFSASQAPHTLPEER